MATKKKATTEQNQSVAAQMRTRESQQQGGQPGDRLAQRLMASWESRRHDKTEE